jgi:redox-sensitive bicupin YhaK (pirin superfamily)
MTNTEFKTRPLRELIPAMRTKEGGGVDIRRAFPHARIEEVDPFLLFDHMGPIEYEPGDATGFPPHPHRGFETVTYLLEGVMEHRDSFGNHGILEPGDVQWMTAGSGLVHSEMPGARLVREGGRLEGFQIWVNLPRRDKMKPPHYQELKANSIPEATSPGGLVKARVVAGETLGVKGAVRTHTPILYVHYTVAPGGAVTQAIPSTHNAIAYVIAGHADLPGSVKTAGPGTLAVFGSGGDQIELRNAADVPLSLLVLAGEPLKEPVARYGPFVMNTREELYQAFADFRSGKMGSLD